MASQTVPVAPQGDDSPLAPSVSRCRLNPQLARFGEADLDSVLHGHRMAAPHGAAKMLSDGDPCEEAEPVTIPGMSPFMGAVAGFVLGESFTKPEIAEQIVSESEKLVYIRQVGAVGFDGVESLEDLRKQLEPPVGRGRADAGRASRGRASAQL